MNLEYWIDFKKDIDIDSSDLYDKLVGFSAWAGSNGVHFYYDGECDLAVSFQNYEEISEFLTYVINGDYVKYIDKGYINEN